MAHVKDKDVKLKDIKLTITIGEQHEGYWQCICCGGWMPDDKRRCGICRMGLNPKVFEEGE